jgi:hypothetical protein
MEIFQTLEKVEKMRETGLFKIRKSVLNFEM